jgi:hypothetical protein
MAIRAETVLAELNRLCQYLDADPGDRGWFTLHQAFCFNSCHLRASREYLDKNVAQGEQPEE